MTWYRMDGRRWILSAGVLLVAVGWLAVPARADTPAGIEVGLDANRLFNQAFLPVLSFGVPVTLQARSTSGQPVRFTGEEGCTVAQVTALPGDWSSAVLTVTSSNQVCRLTVASDAGSGFTESSSTYYLRTRLGQQVAALPSLTRKVAPKTSVTLGPSPLTTDRGMPISVRVVRGEKQCKVTTTKGRLAVVFSGQRGQCTVRASAAGVADQYLPYQRVYVFKVTGDLQVPEEVKPSKPDQSA